MTLVAIESFDTFGTTDGDAGSSAVVAGLDAKYTGSFQNGADMRVYDGWGSGKALSSGRDSSASDNYTLIPVGTPKQEIICGFAFKPRKDPSPVEFFYGAFDTAAGLNHVTCQILYGNTLRVLRSYVVANLLGNIYNAFRPNRWTYVEIRVKVSNTVGEVEVKLNGVQKLNVSGVDTKDGSGADQITHINLAGADGSADTADYNYLWDDVYIVNKDGTSNNDFLGPHKVESIFPDAEGDNIDFTPSTGTDNSALIDENPRNDDTDYNESGTTGHYDLLTAGNLSTITGNIKGIQLNNDARVTDASPVDLINKVKSTVEDEAAAQQVSDTSYVTFFDIWEEDPNTSAAWTVSNVNALQIGYEVG